MLINYYSIYVDIGFMKVSLLRGILIAIIVIAGISLALIPIRIYQTAQAQATANVIVVVHVINDNGGAKQASDFTFQVYTGAHPTGGTCNPGGTYTRVAQFNGSESGTNTAVNAPSCFYVAENTNDVPGYSVTASPCDQPQSIRPHHTVNCIYTFNDL
jgi:hypothetical protein